MKFCVTIPVYVTVQAQIEIFPSYNLVLQVQPSYDDIKRQISANNPVGLSIDCDDEDY